MERLVVAGTGHRPNRLNGGWSSYREWDENMVAFEKTIFKVLKPLVDARQPLHLISGLALGWDSILLRAGIRLQKRYGKELITLEGAIPCSDQDSKWQQKDKRRYQKFLEKLQEEGNCITWVSNQPFSWGRGDQMQRRNEYMVDSCELLLACYDGGSKGGTKKAIDYAKKLGTCDIVSVHPETLEIEKFYKPSTLF